MPTLFRFKDLAGEGVPSVQIPARGSLTKSAGMWRRRSRVAIIRAIQRSWRAKRGPRCADRGEASKWRAVTSFNGPPPAAAARLPWQGQAEPDSPAVKVSNSVRTTDRLTPRAQATKQREHAAEQLAEWNRRQ
jgi:hypothetical protein